MKKQVRETPIHRDTDKWIAANWETVRCWTNIAEALAFAGYTAAATVVTKKLDVWGLVNTSISAGTSIANCLVENPQVEQYFPESEEECQCAANGGQLWASVTRDGVTEKQAVGGTTTSREIVETVYDGDGDALCQYTTTDGTAAFAEIERGGSGEFSVYWYISPAPGSVCCGEYPKPLVPPPNPDYFEIDTYYEQFPERKTYMRIYLIDSEIDHRSIHWQKYGVEEWEEGNTFPTEYYCYWESRTGVFFPNSCKDPHPFPKYEDPCPELPGLNKVNYRLHVPCTWNEDEQGFTDWIDYEIEPTNDGILGLARRIDGIAYLLDRAFQFPYRECNVKTEPEGDWVTIAWISDEPSSDSPLRLRKRTRYRSKSNRDSKQLQQFYKDFTWDAGPVCVKHKGAFWGYPQVWASSVDEGKRVLRHIAGEAGLDPDQVGRWEVSSSSNPRIGQTGRMGIRRLEGMPWVSRRDGSNMLPM